MSRKSRRLSGQIILLHTVKKMTTEKEQLIGDLYSLRAGLALISLNRDKIDNLEQEILEPAIEMRDKVRDAFAIGKRQFEYSTKNEYSKFKEEHKNNLSVAKQAYKKEKCQWWAILTCFVASIFCCTLVLPSLLMLIIKNDEASVIVGIAIGFVVGFIVSLIVARVLNKNARENYLKKVDKINKDYSDYVNSYEDLRRTLEENEHVVAESEEALAVAIEKYNRQKTPIIIQTESITEVLEKLFSPILAISDWGDVDMMIYYLSTGRSDTLKEALQLYDRQRQTDDIIDTIRDAGRRISQEIRSGFQTLGKAMTLCFERLSMQLAEQHTATISSLGALSESIDKRFSEVESKTNELSQQIAGEKELRQALQAKSKENSQKLVSDLNSMKAEINKINKKAS